MAKLKENRSSFRKSKKKKLFLVNNGWTCDYRLFAIVLKYFWTFHGKLTFSKYSDI